MFEPLMREIGAAKRIVLHRHTNPDGDALGAQIGLYLLLRENFPEKEVCKVGDAAGRYAFMEGSEMDVLPDSFFTDALCVVLDCGSAELVSDTRYALAARTARVDHHLFCGSFCSVECVDSTYESCCGMIAAFAREQGLRLTVGAAEALYTGMITDSGRFRYDSTSSRTFALASFLLTVPVDLSKIYSCLYRDELSFVKQRASFISRITMYKDSTVAYIFTSKEELDASGLSPFTASRGMVNVMSDIRGIDVWANFTETENGVLTELRSSKYNVNPTAVLFGGGGHAKASGVTLSSREQIPQVLESLCALTERR